jgi:hypothetical protein
MEAKKPKYICVMSSTEQGMKRESINYNDWAIMVRQETDSYYGIVKDYKSVS